jgi:hypothetical protein
VLLNKKGVNNLLFTPFFVKPLLYKLALWPPVETVFGHQVYIAAHKAFSADYFAKVYRN